MENRFKWWNWRNENLKMGKNKLVNQEKDLFQRKWIDKIDDGQIGEGTDGEIRRNRNKRNDGQMEEGRRKGGRKNTKGMMDRWKKQWS